MRAQRRVLTVIMDGVGERQAQFGNAVALARTPTLHYLRQQALFTTLQAHGTAVGMPSDEDLGNSEVGHNSIGAGRVFAQGATLVQEALQSGRIFATPIWRDLVARSKSGPTLHFIGLLSDGNVHSHEQHLYALLRRAAQEGAQRLRVHVLFDGRDVAPRSAELYCAKLEAVLSELRQQGCDAWAASAGGRMRITMDRYQADWEMVARGWKLQVHGEGPRFPSLAAGITEARKNPQQNDQYIPEYVLCDEQGHPRGPIRDGDGVVFFNFRGDRALEISQAFEDPRLATFARGQVPQVLYAGMMEYSGDERIPRHYLVAPPQIADTVGEYLASNGLRQFACSETQKYGHVTYFWNGNRLGKFSETLEQYVEIPSELIPFDQKPWMRAAEITDATINELLRGSFDCGRINFANGDMVGHTGNFTAARIAVEVVDLMLARLVEACRQTKTILLVTADHGNCEEMFSVDPAAYPQWHENQWQQQPPPKTSHTLYPVPCFIYDPTQSELSPAAWTLSALPHRRLANLANTMLALMGLPTRSLYEPSLVQPR